ncbi:MAG TPA: hypothetical protein PKD52_10920 [Clostridiales bacterium]|nr:hypothetical protein [Clostridiales bacterium]
MKTEEFDPQLVTTCLEQKVTLFTDMLNISKKIEVQTRQDQVILDDLLAKRKILMDRIDKCNALIGRELGYLPETQRLHWQTMLRDNDDAARDEGEKFICALVSKSHELCLKIADLNRVANANLKRQRDDLKKQLKGTKRKNL